MEAIRMGAKSKGAASGAASGAAAGTSVMPGWGTAIGGVIGGVAGYAMTPEEQAMQEAQRPVDPVMLEQLRKQASGEAPTVASLRFKAAMDRTLAQQIAAAKAARGVNPALMNRNISNIAATNAAQSAEKMAEVNLQEQDSARRAYLQAMGMNADVDVKNVNMRNALAGQKNAANEKLVGSVMNAGAAMGSKYAMADSGKKTDTTTDNATDLNKSYSAGADISLGNNKITVPTYEMPSDKRVKKNLKVVSDERQKDLIKNESFPANNTLTAFNQNAQQASMGTEAVQPVAPQAQPVATGNVTNAPTAAPVIAKPLPTAPAQTQAAQTSLNAGGTIADLGTKGIDNLIKPGDHPDDATLTYFANEARRQGRDREAYNQFVQEWYGNNAAQKAEYDKQVNDVQAQNDAIQRERAARLSQFYTGVSNANMNDLANRYIPVVKAPVTSYDVIDKRATASGPDNGVKNLGPTLAGGGIFQYSDENVKTDIKTAGNSMNPKDFLDKLTAYSYEYKNSVKNNSKAGSGKHLSVMAQDLEKAGPVGQQMVKENSQGIKEVDYAKGFAAMLASQVALNERLKKIEGGSNGRK